MVSGPLRIRIRHYLYGSGSGSTDPDPSINRQNKQEKPGFLQFCDLFFDFLSLYTDERNKKTKNFFLKIRTYFLLAPCQPLTKKPGSGSVSQWYGSADPYKNVTDPQHWIRHDVLPWFRT